MLKFLACITMLIDHIGVVFFPTSDAHPNNVIWRMIGRIAMPLFAYGIARGYYYTKKKGTLKKYILNMVIFALISQVPFMLMEKSAGYSIGVNIGMLWLCSLLFLYLIEKNKWWGYVLCLPILVILEYFPFLSGSGWKLYSVDYGIYGLLCVVALYYSCFVFKSKPMLVITMIIANVCQVGISMFMGRRFDKAVSTAIFQAISLMAVLPIRMIWDKDKKLPIPKIVWYLFYPVHMLILVAIKDFSIITSFFS